MLLSSDNFLEGSFEPNRNKTRVDPISGFNYGVVSVLLRYLSIVGSFLEQCGIA